jgi:hypothetical protein
MSFAVIGTNEESAEVAERRCTTGGAADEVASHIPEFPVTLFRKYVAKSVAGFSLAVDC